MRISLVPLCFISGAVPTNVDKTASEICDAGSVRTSLELP